MNIERCELCSRECRRLTRHHLIPQTRHKNKKNKKMFDRQEVKERIAMLCRPCHSMVHATFSEKELEASLNTVELLLAEPQIQTWIAFISKKPESFRPQIKKNSRRR